MAIERTQSSPARTAAAPVIESSTLAALATKESTALTTTPPLRERHTIEMALGTGIMKVGAAWSRHPVAVAVGTSAAYAGLLAAGVFEHVATSGAAGVGFAVALTGFGAAFLNAMTNNGLAQPLLFKGVQIATEASQENLQRGVEHTDLPLVRKSLTRLVSVMTTVADAVRRRQPSYASQLTASVKEIQQGIAFIDKV